MTVADRASTVGNLFSPRQVSQQGKPECLTLCKGQHPLSLPTTCVSMEVPQEQVLDQDSRRMSLSGKRPSKYLRGCETEGKEPIQGVVSSVFPGELQKSIRGVPQSDCIEQHLLKKGQEMLSILTHWSCPWSRLLGGSWLFELLHLPRILPG